MTYLTVTQCNEHSMSKLVIIRPGDTFPGGVANSKLLRGKPFFFYLHPPKILLKSFCELGILFKTVLIIVMTEYYCTKYKSDTHPQTFHTSQRQSPLKQTLGQLLLTTTPLLPPPRRGNTGRNTVSSCTGRAKAHGIILL